MKILDINILRGPNYWSLRHKVIVIKLDIGLFKDLPSDMIEGFTERLINAMPGLYDHHCSPGRTGGFVERLQTGTWMGHIVEHIALELQTMAGMNCNFGKTINAGPDTIYNVAFEYEEENAGEYAASAAVRIAEAIAGNTAFDLKTDVEELRRLYYHGKPGPSTTAIIKAALNRGIPVIRLDNGSMVQLGYGNLQKRIEATLTENTSSIAVDLAADKHKTKEILFESGIPVPRGFSVNNIENFLFAIESLGFPLAIKPNNGNQGNGVSLNIKTNDEAWDAYEKACLYSRNIIVEEYIEANDYRLLVINYRLVASSLRTPAMVTGDGRSTVRKLIEQTNSDPCRGEGHEKILTKIKTDNSVLEYMTMQGISLDDVLPEGYPLQLCRTANLSTGGTAEDVTDIVHPDIKLLAERTARIAGLDICGIDYMTGDISQSPAKLPGYVLEVNAAPGFRMHTNPFRGLPRPVGEAVIEMLFPQGTKSRIPIVAVSGTNGKTTTTRLIAHIAKTAGFYPGYTTTEGIYINDVLIEKGDCTGPVSAAKVLRDRSVDFAILECARGGILRSGLAFDICDTGVITNVAEDHLGLKGINSLEDMARVKAVVIESLKSEGLAVLNANDDSTFNMTERVKSRVGLFSIDDRFQRVKDHCNKGGAGAIYNGSRLILLNGLNEELSISVEEIPIAFGGKAPFMIENILAAMLATWSQGIDNRIIKKALRSFNSSYENTPGRMNLFDFGTFHFLLDYAHNFHSISALGQFIKQFNATTKTGIISAAGDRRDIDIYNIGQASAELFDRIIIRVDEDLRGREVEDIVELIYSGLVNRNKNLPVDVIKDEAEAVRYSLRNAEPGSLIVHFAENISKVATILKEHKEIYETNLIDVK